MALTHIFHLSDLHIRNGDNTYSRYEEVKNDNGISLYIIFPIAKVYALTADVIQELPLITE